MEQVLGELQRILLGDGPPWFLFEIAARTAIIYVYSLLLLRWLGSRTIGQLSTIEFLLVIALGSAVGDAMFYPDVPLLHAMLVITLVIVANRLLDMVIARSKRAERLIDGKPLELVRNGVFQREFLDGGTLGVSEVCQMLRERGIEHLGQVAHAYMEADGAITVFRVAGSPMSGLPIAPPREIERFEEIVAGSAVMEAATLACLRCGTILNVTAGHAPGPCRHCGHDSWTPAREKLLFAEAGGR